MYVFAIQNGNRIRYSLSGDLRLCNNYKFPLYDFIHDTLIKDVRNKLFEKISRRFYECFEN
jgi:hypothetical protein